MKNIRYTCLIMVALLMVGLIGCSGEKDEDSDFAYVVDSGNEFVSVVRYNGESEEAVVPDMLGGKPVKEIAATTFVDSPHVTSIVIGPNVTVIGDPSFKTLPNLANITVSDENVGYVVVDGVLFHKKMKTIYCYPQGRLDDSYILPDTVATIGAGAFFNSKLSTLTMPDTVTKIYANAFAGSTLLKDIHLSEKLSQIYEGAFQGCVSLSDLTLPESVTSIGVNCFSGCTALRDIILPEKVASLGSGAFDGCTNLESVTVKGTSANLQRIAEDTFRGAVNLKSVSYAVDLLGIADRAFAGCTSLESLNMTKNLQVVGEKAFEGCTALKSIYLPETLISIGARAFDGTALLAEQEEEWVTLGGIVLAYRGVDTNVIVPDGVTSISYLNDSVTGVTLPEGVTSISDGAFRGCSALKEISLPQSLTTIGKGAFADCSSLTTITLPAALNSLGEEAFVGCSSMIAFSVDPMNKTFSVDKGVLYNNTNRYLVAYPAASEMTSYSVPYGSTRIAKSAIRGAKNLEIFISTDAEDLTIIDEYAFADCQKLKSVKFHENFRTIGDYAFLNCISLSDYTTNYQMTGIGKGAFMNCTALSKLEISQPLSSIGEDAFAGTQCELTVYRSSSGEAYVKAYNLKYTRK